MKIAENRPPYVTFETRAIEDRNASIEAGHFVAKDVDFALVTPQGSKDRVELVVAEWFQMLEQEVRSDRFPLEWLSAFKSAYSHWKEGRELPPDGFPIVNWPVLSPAQVRTFLDIGIRTIEDVAAMNEEAILRIGMGARNLKQRAEEWLKTAGSDQSKNSEKLAALQQENLQLKETLKSIQEEFQNLKKSLETKK